MENEKIAVPYIVYEGEQARNERRSKRLIVALMIAVILLFASNALWLYAWTCYDYIGFTDTVTVDAGDGIANYIGANGDIKNGAGQGR